MPDPASNPVYRFGQALMVIGASLAFLSLLGIRPLSSAFWSHWLNCVLFLAGVILAIYAKQRATGAEKRD